MLEINASLTTHVMRHNIVGTALLVTRSMAGCMVNLDTTTTTSTGDELDKM